MPKKYYYFKVLFWLLLATISVIAITFSGLYLYLNPKLPNVETLRQVRLQTPLRIYSSDNRLIGEFGEQRRTPITHAQMPQRYIQALLSAEDAQFYQHNGVSIKGLLRAASELLQTGSIQSGGSTITMQVARNFFLTFNQTFARKLNEILLALQIEQELSKEEILALYNNKIYFGNRAYGIQAAANVYYGENIDQLSLAQLAMIAGLPKAPSAYNPIVNPKRAIIRRNWILGRMLELNHINKTTYTEAVNEPVSAKYHGLTPELYAPFVAELARLSAVKRFGNKAYTDGYNVYTTVNAHLQEMAQKSVVNGVIAYDLRHGYRGPEQNLSQLSPAEQLSQLSNIPVYGGLKPGLIRSIDEQAATVLFADESTFVLHWDNGISSARPYINENSRGATPKSISDVLTVGDIIRLRPEINESWTLSQLPTAEAALLALDPSDGAIQSMVGGFDFQESHFNRITQATRQPGSSFKPFIYLTALENGYTPATIVNDAPIVIEDASLEGTWRPENDGGTFLGPTRLRKALYQSRNIVSIRILRALGMEKAHASLERFGFNKEGLPHDLSLALGSHDITPLKLAEAYATLANGGFKIAPYLIARIETLDGSVAFQEQPATVCKSCEQLESENVDALNNNLPPYEATEARTLEELLTENNQPPLVLDEESSPLPRPNAVRVVDKQTAYIINSMLKDVIARGTGRKARVLKRNDLAGKTGTSNGPRDAWFAGYNPDIVTIAWLGFDESTFLGNNEYGTSAALPIWIDYMREALKDKTEAPSYSPDGIVSVKIDPDTGERANINNPNAIFEIFRTEDAPTTQASTNKTQDESSSEVLPEELF